MGTGWSGGERVLVDCCFRAVNFFAATNTKNKNKKQPASQGLISQRSAKTISTTMALSIALPHQAGTTPRLLRLTVKPGKTLILRKKRNAM
jgi:hypothetical protein